MASAKILYVSEGREDSSLQASVPMAVSGLCVAPLAVTCVYVSVVYVCESRTDTWAPVASGEEGSHGGSVTQEVAEC